MKKLMIGLLCATTMVSTVLPAFAADTNVKGFSQNHVAVTTQKSTVQYVLQVNGKAVSLGSQKIVKIKNCIMIPLRITSKALGCTVTWNGKEKTAHVSDGSMQADLTLGVDSYCAYSVQADGMTTPQKLGVAPTLIQGSVYVPVDFYKTLFTDENSVTINDNIVKISTSAAKTENTQDKTEIPNPLVSYSTLDEARKAVGFVFAVPSTLPDKYLATDIIVISNDLAEIFYRNGDKTILYRTAKGNQDISGDYIIYETSKTITLGNTTVTVKGTGDTISLATWFVGDTSFSLSFDEPVDQNVLASIVNSIK